MCSSGTAGNGAEPAKPNSSCVEIPAPNNPEDALERDGRPQQREKEFRESCSLCFPHSPLSCGIFAVGQRFLPSSGPHICDISGCYGGSVEKKPLLLLFKGNYSVCPRSKAPGSRDVPLRHRETQTKPKNSNIWISWVTARLSCAHFPLYIIQGLFLKLQGANSGDERHLPRSFPGVFHEQGTALRGPGWLQPSLAPLPTPLDSRRVIQGEKWSPNIADSSTWGLTECRKLLENSSLECSRRGWSSLG